MPKKIELQVGEKRHNLIYLGQAPRQVRHRMIHVACDCGRETIIQLGKFGRNKTCRGALDRCHNENSPSYKYFWS